MQKIAIAVNNSRYAWNMRINLGLALSKSGYEVIFICPYDKYSEKIKKFFDYVNISIDAETVNPIKDLKNLYKYYKIYKEIKPDIILQYTIKPNIYGSIAANILNIPTINNIAGLGTLFAEENFITKVAKSLYKISQRKAKKIFFQNHDDFQLFINEGLVQKTVCDVIPGSGVDLEKFRFVNKKKDRVFRFLLASRMIWAKGIKEYVDAAKIIKSKYENIEFQLLGHYDIKSPKAISKDQINIWEKSGLVKYLGSSDDVRIEIAHADCIVLPSFYREGIPRILLESASMQKPIITTNNFGCRNVVEDGVNGYLCKIKNPQDLSRKMEMMLSLTNKQRQKMGKYGRIKVEKEFDEKIVIKKYIETVKTILK